VRRNTDRIQTTHAGSLPRPDDLTRLMWDSIDGKAVDAATLKRRVAEAVCDVVSLQRTAGIDVISDGEMSKIGFSNYVIQRFSGFGERAQFMATDLADFPILIREAVKSDIANFKSALGNSSPDDAFIPAVTPGQMLFNFPNHYYPTREEYLEAAGNALRVEYQAIVDAGFNLQLDSPDLAMHRHSFSDGKGPTTLKSYIPLAIEALNHATRGIPAEKMRLHLCWGNYAGPHHHDVEMRDIIEPVLKANASFIYFEAANPRHEHEWEVWNEVKLPDDKAIIPGVIDTVTNTVEHPRLVAQRLERFAKIVGRENVIGGTDCGFGTFVGFHNCDPKIAWLKLEALAQGARMASEELW
jgi:5-methyltetrahydropteroyltriglutamate--homocysteine methyltransferase